MGDRLYIYRRISIYPTNTPRNLGHVYRCGVGITSLLKGVLHRVCPKRCLGDYDTPAPILYLSENGSSVSAEADEGETFDTLGECLNILRHDGFVVDVEMAKVAIHVYARNLVCHAKVGLLILLAINVNWTRRSPTISAGSTTFCQMTRPTSVRPG